MIPTNTTKPRKEKKMKEKQAKNNFKPLRVVRQDNTSQVKTGRNIFGCGHKEKKKWLHVPVA